MKSVVRLELVQIIFQFIANAFYDCHNLFLKSISEFFLVFAPFYYSFKLSNNVVSVMTNAIYCV